MKMKHERFVTIGVNGHFVRMQEGTFSAIKIMHAQSVNQYLDDAFYFLMEQLLQTGLPPIEFAKVLSKASFGSPDTSVEICNRFTIYGVTDERVINIENPLVRLITALEQSDNHKRVEFIKYLRQTYQIGLKEAKDMYWILAGLE